MRVKPLIVQTGFKLLGRGLVSCSKIEQAVQDELAFYNDGFIIELIVFKTDTKVAVEKRGERFYYLGSQYTATPDLSIIFKSYESALLLILGKIAVYEGYAQHRFLVKGDFINGMPLVRMLYFVEAYLFPRFIHQHILKDIPERSASKLKAYIHLFI